MKEIEADMASRRRPMEILYLEVVQTLWTKILLRTLMKVGDAMQLVFYSANTWNAYGCALGARSILEHVAFLEYFASKTPWIEKPYVDLKDAIPFTKELLKLSTGSRFDWDRLMHGQIRHMVADGKWQRPKDERIPLCADLIKSLEIALRKAGKLEYKNEIGFLYGILCDVVHPSWGGDFIYGPDIRQQVKPSGEQLNRFKASMVIFCGSLLGITAHLVRLYKSLTTNVPNLILQREP